MTSTVDISSPSLLPPTARESQPATHYLNTFQRLILRWNEFAPYNASQAMLVSGVPDRVRWQQAIESAIGELGLGRPVRTNADRLVTFQPAGPIHVEISPVSLETLLNTEINRPFAGTDLPIRFFIVSREPGAHYLVAVYDHWIADSRGMRELMHRIFVAYRGGPSHLAPLTLAAPSFLDLYRRHLGAFPALPAIRQSLRNCFRHRHAFRVNLLNPLDFTARVLYRQLPVGLIEAVHATAKARGASVNDAFLAVLGHTMGQASAAQRYARRHKRFHFQRNAVGLGTIVDIRDLASQPLDHVFGLYLSYYTVTLRQPEQQPIYDLLTHITAETKPVKQHAAMIRGFTALAVGLLWWNLAPTPKDQAQVFHKVVPTMAGTSNVNLTGSWVDPAAAPLGADDRGQPAILDYLRISPAGPLLPLAFTLTTIGQRLSLCMTYRTTAFTDEQAQMLIEDFISRLQQFPR